MNTPRYNNNNNNGMICVNNGKCTSESRMLSVARNENRFS